MPSPRRSSRKIVQLVANGDLRASANEKCWPAQAEMEATLTAAVAALGYRLVRAHPYEPALRHGFIGSQKQGIEVFRHVDPDAPLIVAESVWQYSHHLLHGLLAHRGPILTIANWSGTWPGLVGMLNLNGSLTKAGVTYSTLWSETFEDAFFREGLESWLSTGRVRHRTAHVRPLARATVPARARAVARRLADDLRTRKSIMGVFDEGCMGMYNAIIPDELLFPLGIFKERLSQSALYYAATQVTEAEAREVFDWYRAKGLRFHFGKDEATELTSPWISRSRPSRTSAKISQRSRNPQRITQTIASSRKPIPETGFPSQRLPWKKFQPARTSTVTRSAEKSASKSQW